MPTLIVSDPSTGKSQKIDLEDSRYSPLIGKRIGEIIDGNIANMPGYKLKITGGNDKDGIPMRTDIHGSVKISPILSEGVGYHPKTKGERKRKVIRGNMVSTDIKFLNLMITEQPKSRKKTDSKLESVSTD
ncbi:30S ribosomal protein S6e [Candidatus Bathyarchaeota archaeon]|nr:30S ribosomal protein S6e [Candidatus Bathyarchaeota archaeon]